MKETRNRIYITTERGYQKSIEEGQRIIVKSPLANDFNKEKKGNGIKKERIAYIYQIISPDKIIINMLSSKDKVKTNQSIQRTDSKKPLISIRKFYFVTIDYSLILNAKNDILDQKEMLQFQKIVNTYSEKKQKLIQKDEQKEKNRENSDINNELELEI